jgi:hypothetical protein
MSAQRVSVNPMLEEDQAQWILGITVDRVQEAAGFLPGPANMPQAEGEDLLDPVRQGADTAGHDEHPPKIATSVAEQPQALGSRCRHHTGGVSGKRISWATAKPARAYQPTLSSFWVSV